MVEIYQQSLSHPHAHPLSEEQNHSYFHFSDMFQVFSHKSVGRSLGNKDFMKTHFGQAAAQLSEHCRMKFHENLTISSLLLYPTTVQIACFYCQTFYGKDAVFSHLENSIFISRKASFRLVITTL